MNNTTIAPFAFLLVLFLVIWLMPTEARKARKINKLKIKLAGAKAEWDMERQVMRNSGEIFPMKVANLTREIAELEEELRQLEGRPENTEPRTNPL